VLFSVAFLVLWLLPMAYRGVTGNRQLIPAYPVFLRYLHVSSCLFTHRAGFWPVLYMQLQFSPSDHWTTLPDDPFFQMSPFGYRVRLDEFYRMKMYRYPLAREELARWIAGRYQQLHPHEAAPTGFRIVLGRYQSRSNVPPGQWTKPLMDAFSPEDLTILYTYQFQPAGDARE